MHPTTNNRDAYDATRDFTEKDKAIFKYRQLQSESAYNAWKDRNERKEAIRRRDERYSLLIAAAWLAGIYLVGYLVYAVAKHLMFK